ncbi:serine/threonine-protein kinase [Spongiactinospora sp. TRM90649]|uniref:serine/threonine-protein kinase n=1 Tax=Spongiactinospora sp. TRM90649 TaxID=3031114 RepID=UPI0023F657E3|nr:serine/threonine-protein kinase [Spongiactinospora sp. TRM90649]MDF5752308.1 serine/threonine-protein kinase [Spongiactinospora sp. TRM90649]
MQAQPLSPDDPRALGSYQLIGRIGEGGQGVVYLGRGRSGEQVAVKLLHGGLASDEDARARFLREVAVAQRVAAFCTARVLHADLAGNRPYIVSEYVAGPSLRQLVNRDGPRRGGALERLAISTATALAAIHQAGILHRDLKPANVLMGPEGPVVIDFGIARALDAPGTTATGIAMGTPSYLAPEHLAGAPISPASDVFAWGVTMVFAATGRPAFGQDSIPVVMNRILNSEPDLGDLSGPIRDVVAACLAKDPALRPTAEELVGHLTGRPIAPLRTAAHPPQAPAHGQRQPGHIREQVTGPARHRPRARGRRPAVMAAAATAGLLALGGGSVVLANSGTFTLMADGGADGSSPTAAATRNALSPGEPLTQVPPPLEPATDGWTSPAPTKKARPSRTGDGGEHAAGERTRTSEPAPERTASPEPTRNRTKEPTAEPSEPDPEPTSEPTPPPPTKTTRPTSRPSPTKTTAPPKPKPTPTKTTAPPKPNPNSPAGVCGSGYKVINSHSLGGKATAYLLYSAAAGRNCVVTLSKYVVPGKIAMSATLQVKGGSTGRDSGSFTVYAGPVRLAAAKKCVIWGGSYGSIAWKSGWSHCG